jgi:IS30 family transposase
MKNRKVTEQEWNYIHELRESGKSQRDIATITGRPKATVQWVLNGKKPDFNPVKPEPYKAKHEFQELQETDLSSLPDTALFKHSKEFFI